MFPSDARFTGTPGEPTHRDTRSDQMPHGQTVATLYCSMEQARAQAPLHFPSAVCMACSVDRQRGGRPERVALGLEVTRGERGTVGQSDTSKHHADSRAACPAGVEGTGTAQSGLRSVTGAGRSPVVGVAMRRPRPRGWRVWRAGFLAGPAPRHIANEVSEVRRGPNHPFEAGGAASPCSGRSSASPTT
eukprot:scaffold2280_cov430-Prasinococcus_capsulatus_cf.AAC.18